MNIFKFLVLFGIAFASPVVNADKLPFETFAYKIITEGYQNGDTLQLREGARRCGGAMILANHLGWVQDATISGSDSMLSYKGISSASIYHRFVTIPDEDITQEAIHQEREEEALFYRGYAENYRSWLEKSETIDHEAFEKSMADRDGLTPMDKLPSRHPFSIEVSKCYEVGLELYKVFSQ